MASSRASSSISSSLVLGVLLAAALLAGPGAAQSSSAAPAPSSAGSCVTEMVSLYPCLGYMSTSSSTKPSASCCAALSSVVASDPRCLCAVLGGGASSLGVSVNTTRALELPAACDVKTPPPSECKSVGVPVPSSSSPAATTPSTTTPASPAAASATATPAAGAGTTKATQLTAESSGDKQAATSVFPVAVVVLSAAAVALLHA